MTALEPSTLGSVELDYLLAEVATALQLSSTHYDRAKQHYSAASDWLAAGSSPLAHLSPQIYPQGSIALQTTVRPRGGVEYDLDFVCEVDRNSWSALELYGAVYNRFFDNLMYRPMLSMKKRCISIAYQGDFHLDIIPAVRLPRLESTSILIPDRDLEDWTPSNPKGYIDWFQKRSEVLLQKGIRLDAEVQPLPQLQSLEQKAPLVIAVQLIKRARDVLFDGDDDAPRSIVLTTLAGHCYTGGASVLGAIREITAGITEILKVNPLELINPSEPSERFSDGFTAERIANLHRLASSLHQAMESLAGIRGFDAIQRALATIFGEEPSGAAVSRFGQLLLERRRTRSLTYSPRGLEIVQPTSALRVPANTYFGD